MLETLASLCSSGLAFEVAYAMLNELSNLHAEYFIEQVFYLYVYISLRIYNSH
jgi:hypothetical protein